MEQLLKDLKLNWTVRQESVQSESGVTFPFLKALIREDNNAPLAVMGDGYEPYQNHELLETILEVSDKLGVEIHTGGFFGDGQKVYMQLKGDDLTLGDDVVKGYITGVNSFDGSTSLAFGTSNITISCKNTFHSAFRSLKTKVRHTKNMRLKVEDVLKAVEIARMDELGIFKVIRKYYEHEVPTKKVEIVREKIARSLFDIKPEIDIDDADQISSQKRNKITDFYVDLNGELKQKGANLWGLFSGVTKYTTHHLYKDGRDTTEAKMFGVYGTRERNIFNSLPAMLEKD